VSSEPGAGAPASASAAHGGDGAALAERLRAGDRRALARALTRIEDGAEPELRDLVARLHPFTGHAQLVGVTGPPGVGKSTLTSALVRWWRQRDATVGVVAVDPTSPFTGGALLGDRIRMQDHILDRGVFIRSMATRGHLGGLSWATPQALLVMDAAGFDVVVLETVGVGQAEVEVAGVADTTVVAVAPDMGDAVQAAKAGILEAADVFVVNKADREGAGRTVRELRDSQRLGHGPWMPPIVSTVASRGEGIDELAAAIADHRAWLAADDRLRARRLHRARVHVRELAVAALRSRMGAVAEGVALDAVAGQVVDLELDPYAAADTLVAALGG
jgi:LAO/AO transport system kinase